MSLPFDLQLLHLRSDSLNVIQPPVHGSLHRDPRVSRSSQYHAQPLRTASLTAVTPFTLMDKSGHRDRIPRGDFGDPETKLPASDTKGFFEGPLTLYRRHTNLLTEALAHSYNPAQVHVVYVAPDNRIFRMASWFEQEMLGMFEIRSVSGRCTHLFGDRNIHIDLSPISTTPEGWLIGIGKDTVHTFQDGERTTILSALDMEHAIRCRERIMKSDDS